ncbi:LptA/OstA family protein [Sulfitobacter sp. LCG007]
MPRLSACLALILLAAAPGPVLAQSANVSFGALKQDTALPVEVTADDLAVDNTTGSAVFSGNVVIVQGEMRLGAQEVLVVYTENRDAIARLEAKGGVTLVSGPDAAESRTANYDIDSGTIVMVGDVLLTQGKSALSAERMTVHLEDGTAQMSGRVRTILQTGDN